MREIKFMAWDKIHSRFNICNIHIDGTGLLFWQFGNNCDIIPMEERKQFDIQLYTGLKDKSGKEIYVNFIIQDNRWDIEKDGDKRIVRDYKGAYWAERIIPKYDDNDLILLSSCNALSEIIGNIYENPELLEEK